MIRKDERFDESYYREWLCDQYVFNEERKAIVRFYLKMVLSRKRKVERISNPSWIEDFGSTLHFCNEINEIWCEPHLL